jgi:hypothetical protein
MVGGSACSTDLSATVSAHHGGEAWRVAARPPTCPAATLRSSSALLIEGPSQIKSSDRHFAKVRRFDKPWQILSSWCASIFVLLAFSPRAGGPP